MHSFKGQELTFEVDMQAVHKIKELYREIYNNGNEQKFVVWKSEDGSWSSEEKAFNELAHFTPMEGTLYRECPSVRLLIIGRAVNGWYTSNATNEQEYCDQIEKAVLHKGFDWIIEENGTLYNKSDNGTKGDYRVASPFWDLSKSVFEYLNGAPSEIPKWVEYTVWTNLYKIAPTYCGNPEGEMKTLQKKQCIEMLKKEIQYFSPTHILALTGWDNWMAEFEEVFDVGSVTKFGVNISKGKNKNNIYLEAQGKIDGIPVAIACRPEFRPKEEYIADVVKAFNSESNN